MVVKLLIMLSVASYGVMPPCAGVCGRGERNRSRPIVVRPDPPAAHGGCRSCQGCRCNPFEKLAELGFPQVDHAPVDRPADGTPGEGEGQCSRCTSKGPRVPLAPPTSGVTLSESSSAVHIVADMGAVGSETPRSRPASGHDPPGEFNSHNERQARKSVWRN